MDHPGDKGHDSVMPMHLWQSEGNPGGAGQWLSVTHLTTQAQTLVM